MKEVFHRVGAMILLFAVYFKYIDIDQFMIGIVSVYVLFNYFSVLFLVVIFLSGTKELFLFHTNTTSDL